MPADAAGADLADRIAAMRSDVVADALAVLFERHPEWKTRWGLHGKEMTERDTAYHVEFLEAALRSGQPRVFTRYTAWLGGILTARGVPTEALAESFEVLADVLEHGLDTNAAMQARTVLEQGVRAINDPAPVPGTRTAPAHPVVPLLVQALLDADRHGADRILRDLLDSGLDIGAVGDQVVQPAMTEIGRLWQHDQITVAQEHLATAIVQTSLARAFARAELPAPGEKAVFACVEGNHHALGLRIVADAHELSGWDVRYLGADVPMRDLLRQLEQWQPSLLALSIALPQHVATARRTIDAVRERMGDRAPRIVVGGLPLNDFEGLADVLGADEWYPGAVTMTEGRA